MREALKHVGCLGSEHISRYFQKCVTFTGVNDVKICREDGITRKGRKGTVNIWNLQATE